MTIPYRRRAIKNNRFLVITLKQIYIYLKQMNFFGKDFEFFFSGKDGGEMLVYMDS